jgi:hypothetical protein
VTEASALNDQIQARAWDMASALLAKMGLDVADLPPIVQEALQAGITAGMTATWVELSREFGFDLSGIEIATQFPEAPNDPR